MSFQLRRKNPYFMVKVKLELVVMGRATRMDLAEVIVFFLFLAT
jgi:hypothetical protein